jgi:hypothetical protein
MSPQTLRKGATFHSPRPVLNENNFTVPSLPRRSQTTLEDVVDAHQRRVEVILQDIDRVLSFGTSSKADSSALLADERLPISQSYLNHTVEGYYPNTGDMASDRFNVNGRSLRPRRQQERHAAHRHTSDSGIGSSIMSGSEKACAVSAITSSAAPHQTFIEELPRLSERATSRIHEHIFKPLLADASLKPFHPLVNDCPARIHSKEIVCLRDLEKTLLLSSAPVSEQYRNEPCVRAFNNWFSSWLKEHSTTTKLYMDFCMTTIRCVQTTVGYLSDRERTRPTDRPYNNGYFIDLVEQIRNYAQTVQASKEKEEQGEDKSKLDVQGYDSPRLEMGAELGEIKRRASFEPRMYMQAQSAKSQGFHFAPADFYITADANISSPRTEQIKLFGGISKNGRPAELVRVKEDGTHISLATGKEIKIESIEEEDEAFEMKRSLSDIESDDESILRSMARRKRSASAARLIPKRCSHIGCTKEFTRSCDLTKHEKTHSRPFKCKHDGCKYTELGWPTEKELDRHLNDKHNPNPKKFRCLFPPCAYESKRESNCKQHMEKTHAWVYVKSKSNGRNKDQQKTLPTPQTTNLETPVTHNHLTPPSHDWDMDHSSVMVNQDVWPQMDHHNVQYPQTFDVDFNAQMISPVDSHLQYGQSSTDTSPFSANAQDFMDTMDTMDEVSANFGSDFARNQGDFTLFEDLYGAPALIPATTLAQIPQILDMAQMPQGQHTLPTPDQSIFVQQYNMGDIGIGQTRCTQQQLVGMSPVGQGNADATLFTPPTLTMNDNFGAFADNGVGPDLTFADDFTLFKPSGINTARNSLFGGFNGQNSGQTHDYDFTNSSFPMPQGQTDPWALTDETFGL